MNRKELKDQLALKSGHLEGMQKIKWTYRPYVCPMVEILQQIPEGKKLFDIGCGNGNLLYLAQQFRGIKKAGGYDVIPSAVEAANKLGNIDVLLLSPEGPMPSFSGYDIITLVDVLHHVPKEHQKNFLVSIIREMDVGSSLLIADINADKKIGARINWLHDMILARESVSAVPLGEVSKVLLEQGVKVVHSSLHRTLWYPHYILKIERLDKAS